MQDSTLRDFKSKRIPGVDTFRVFAVIAVIVIHTQPFAGMTRNSEAYRYLSVIVNQLARFGVPFFFVISGYFWGINVRSGVSPFSLSLGKSKNILRIYFIWCLIYVLPFDRIFIQDQGFSEALKIMFENVCHLAAHPLALMLQGTKGHLWFLTALICSLWVSAFFVNRKHDKPLLFLSITMYLIALLTKAYSLTPLGIQTEFNMRNGPFFGTIFFVSGYFLSGLKPNMSWFRKGIFLLGLGCVLHFLEIYLLWRFTTITPYQDFVFGTYLMGVGAAMTALSNHLVIENGTISRVGRLTLGIYAIHFIFVDILRCGSKALVSPFWEVGYVICVFALSVLSVTLLSKNKVLKKIVD